MAERELKAYLESERSAGQFAGSGSFGVDFQAAMAKRSHFTLPRPGLWAVRVVQAMMRYGARSISVEQSRRALLLRAPLRAEPELAFPLSDLFHEHPVGDPRSPLQGGLLAALGRSYELELHWSEGGRRRVMSLSGSESTIGAHPEPMNEPTLEVRVRPADGNGLLARLFSVADFSHEFRELHRACTIAPIPVLLDSRPVDLASGFAAHFFPALEFRGVRATSGPRLRLRPELTFELERHSIADNDYFQPMLGGNYAFLLSVGWSEKERMSTVAWVQDGVLVDEEPLFRTPSQLEITLFLPADGLANDITGLALRDSKERKARLREARLWATTSLKTRLPPTPPAPSGTFAPLQGSAPPTSLGGQAEEEQRFKALWVEVEARMGEALDGSAYSTVRKRSFRDAIEEHLREAEQASRRTERDAADTAIEEEETPRTARGSLARWGAFLSYVPQPEEEPFYFDDAAKGPGEGERRTVRVRQFFGETYVEFPTPREERS